MEVINELSILNILLSSFSDHHKLPKVEFSWEHLGSKTPVLNGEYNKTDASFLLQLSLMVSNANKINKELEPPFWLESRHISIVHCPVNIDRTVMHKIDDAMLAYVFYNERTNLLIVVFTGTVNACLLALDIEYDQVDIDGIDNYVNGMKCHRGVYTAYRSIRHELHKILKPYLKIKPLPRICVTGHSLGAALSNICSLDLAKYSPINYTFAGPCIFNKEGFMQYTRIVKKSFRIANSSDLITMIPLPIMPNGNSFFHVGELVSFQMNLDSYSLNHSSAYILYYEIPYKLI